MTSTQPTPPKRRAEYRPPAIVSKTTGVTVLLACTGRFDCEPIVGYPCCKPNANSCGACKP